MANSELKAEQGTRSTSGVEFRVITDTRNSILFPTSGVKNEYAVELDGGPFFGDTDIMKFNVETSRYYSFFDKNLVLFLHGSLGYIQEYGGTDRTPIFERFFAGGSRSLRGYDYRDVGPRSVERRIFWEPISDWLPLQIPVLKEVDNVVGGNLRILGNLELRHPFTRKFTGYVFLDGGTVSEDVSDFDTDDMRYGAGIGISFLSPIGPIRLEYGVPLNADKYQDNGQFYFTTAYEFR